MLWRRPASAPFTVLVVCTGNICRSALAERLGRAYLAEALGADASALRLVSAGTQAVVGSAMHPDSALVLGGFGAEPGDFRARQLHAKQAIEADLILTMTRSHRRLVLHEAPRALAKTFTLLEGADLLDRLPAGVAPAGDDLADRARGLVREMAAARSTRQVDEGDDVRDPIGGPAEAHQAAGDAIVGAFLPLLARLVALKGAPDALDNGSTLTAAVA